MRMLEVEYVSAVRGQAIEIVSSSGILRPKLRQLGAKRSLRMAILDNRFPSRRWRLKYSDEADLARLLSSLRDLDLAFAYDQHGWSPAGVFEELRRKGLIVGSFAEIAWLGPDKPVITVK